MSALRHRLVEPVILPREITVDHPETCLLLPCGKGAVVTLVDDQEIHRLHNAMWHLQLTIRQPYSIHTDVMCICMFQHMARLHIPSLEIFRLRDLSMQKAVTDVDRVVITRTE